MLTPMFWLMPISPSSMWHTFGNSSLLGMDNDIEQAYVLVAGDNGNPIPQFLSIDAVLADRSQKCPRQAVEPLTARSHPVWPARPRD